MVCMFEYVYTLEICTKIDHVWYIDDMIGDWKSISVRNQYYVCYLDGWCVSSIVYICRVYFYACMEEGVMWKTVGVKDSRWWIDRVIDEIIDRVISGG